MKNYKTVVLVLIIGALFLSCASGPPAPVVDASTVAAAREAADAARAAAEEVKAPKAAKAEFDEAAAAYEAAAAAENSGTLEVAQEGFDQSAEKFNESAAVAKKKRDDAKMAIDAAADAIAGVERKAEEAVQAAKEAGE